MAGANAPHIAVFTKNRTNSAYAAARLGADRTAARLGGRTSHYVPDRPDDIEQQIALIDSALRERPDAFVFVPVHVSGVNAAVARINAAGIPIFNFINRLASGERVTFVGSDDVSLAIAVAERLFKHLDHRGEIVIMQGTPGSTTSMARLQGFREAAQRHSAIRVAAECAGDYQHEPARAAMAELLRTLPRIDGALCANDLMALGAIEAMQAAKRLIPIVGVNALPEAIVEVKAGTLLATADFDALKLGCIATEAALRHLRGETVPSEILLPVQVVDAANYAAWDRPLEERECPRWSDVVR